MPSTVPRPTADEALERIYNQRAQGSESVDMVAGEKYALVLLRLNSAVTPDDYAALGAAVNAVTGIQGVSLVVDNQNGAGEVTAGADTLPANKKYVADIEYRVAIRNV